MTGWIKLHRKLISDPLWLSEVFTKGQAWVDLIALANFEDSFFYKRGVRVEVKRGEVGISELGLSDRWKWSRSKVRKFISDLEKEHQVKQRKDNVTQVITIINYDEYQKKEHQKDTKKTPKGHQKDTSKEEKEEKENIFIRKQLFSDKVLNEYSDINMATLTEFISYWTEHGERDRKMRFEKQTSFDIKRRLNTWITNQKKFNNEKNRTNNRRGFESNATQQTLLRIRDSIE